MLFSSVSTSEIVVFTKHLATLVKSGIPLSEALKIIQEQTQNRSFKKILEKVNKSVESGKTLGDSLKKEEKLFGPLYIQIISISEKSGTLVENLDFLSIQLTKDLQLKQKIQAAMLYPGIVFVATTIMGGVLSFMILPQLIDFFEAFQITLPISTQILLFVAVSIRDYGTYIVAGIIAFIAGIWGLLQIPAVKLAWHTWQLKIPIFGPFLVTAELARFARNTGTLLKGGVHISEGLEVVAASMTNLKLKNDTLEANKHLSKGTNLEKAFGKISKTAFSPLMIKMIGVGERSGNLEETLLYVSEFYEEEVDNIGKNISTLVEPIMLLLVGLLVGFVAMAIISPIYELSGSIRR